MYTTDINTTITEKETIVNLNFPKNEVLKSQDAKNERNSNIRYAVQLGNNEKHKVKIIFEDDTSIKKVHTTLWGVGDKNVILKKGVLIPIHRVHKIKFY